MTLTLATFAPQIDYGAESNFIFSENDMYLVQAPDEHVSFRWDSASVPNRDGGDSYGGEKNPLSVSFRFMLESVDPDVVRAKLALLTTALRGRESATATWAAGHFRFYLHKSGDVYLYLNQCKCDALRYAVSADKFYKAGSLYTLVEISLTANDPEWKTASPGAAAFEVDAPLIINVPAGAASALIVNSISLGSIQVRIDVDGNVKTVGEFYEQQAEIEE